MLFVFLNSIQNFESESKNNNISNNNSIDCWTDGSCMPNPGPGGSAVYFPNNLNWNESRAINHMTTINYCELEFNRDVLKLSLEKSIIAINQFENQEDDASILEFFGMSRTV